MKINRKALTIATGSLLMMSVSAVYAFHDGGVANCQGCHTMHNSNNGVEWNVNYAKDQRLLKGSDASSTCLGCHNTTGAGSSFRISSTTTPNLTPGGDFFWLKNTYSIGSKTYKAEQRGHNIIAADYGYAIDPVNSKAPGGAYLSSDLSCVSCHDPHGRIDGGTPNGAGAIEKSGSYEANIATTGILGNYRLLGDAGYGPINADAPIAWTVGYGETDATHPSYGSGMSEWCASCHGDFLVGNTEHKHPSGAAAPLGAFALNYNSYIKTGVFTGAQATAYNALVPFETGATVRTALPVPTSTAGPDATANVSCLSCHRAHASAFDNMTRWDVAANMLTSAIHPTSANIAGISDTAAYYGRDMKGQYGDFQRSLCNKCHGKD